MSRPAVLPLLGTALSLGAGLAIAWVDTRPGWDDTGVTAGLLAIAAAAGALARVPPWLAAALAAGPLLIAELPRGTGVLLAIPVALVGAYVGELVRRRTLGRDSQPHR
jgi:hypothetical protein